MGLSPWYTGQTSPDWRLAFVSESDFGAQAYVDLTGYTVTLWLAPASASPAFVQGLSTVSVTTPSRGEVVYVVNAGDAIYTTPGDYLIQLKATLGAAVKKSDYIPVQVLHGA